MADDEKKDKESAETEKLAPVKKSASAPHLLHGQRPWAEKAHWTLGIVYYGSHLATSAWLTAQEQVFPLVQQYM
ncbi:hypothetical protein FHS35_009245 [Streptomyces umbrinus]|uniref:hypothetical protein n=1 Tax=Streptomyces umbrinus TaxID=67370 RepID=UPI00167E79B4|nr:hypothetical protein [Streptomyces umbrinus]MCR3732327.1 hypothetical protein [Streptomyces umbrinus]GHH68048.1 hypothetical protein GCM10018775_92310 [Streptomyces umbrinus]